MSESIYFRESRRPGQDRWDVYFALELSEMSISRPVNPGRYAKACERMANFLRGAFLPDQDMGTEFRIICHPEAVAPDRQVRVAIRIRVSHRQRRSACAQARDIVAGLLPGWAAASPESLWIPVVERKSYDALFCPFRIEGIGEIQRRVEDVQILASGQPSAELRLGRGGRPDDDRALPGTIRVISPFILVADAWARVIQILMLQRGPTLISVGLAPTRLAQLEKGLLREQIGLCEFGLSEAAGGEIEGGSVGSAAATDIMAQTLHSLRMLSDCGYLLKIQAAGAGGVSGPLLSTIGAALFAPAGSPNPATGAGGWLQSLRGGFSVRSAGVREQYRVAAGNLERLAFDPWPTHGRGAGRLPWLVGPCEIAGLFSVSQSDSGALPGFSAGDSRRVPVPQAMPGAGVLLGVASFNGRPHEVRCSDEDLARHTLVLGSSGSGKTNLLANICRDQILAGKGIAVIDPLGGLVQQLLPKIPESRRGDLVHVDFGDPACTVALNLLEHEGLMERDIAINHLGELIFSLYDKSCVGPMFELFLTTGCQLAMADPEAPGTLLDVVRIFADKEFASKKLSACKEEHVREAWQMMRAVSGEASLKEIAPYIVSKLNRLVNNHFLRDIVSKPRSSIDLSSIMNGSKILLVDLSKGRIGKTYASFLGLILMSLVVRATLKRSRNSPQFSVVVDEMHDLVTESFSEILAQARQFRVSATLSTQTLLAVPSGVRSSILANCGTTVALRVGSQDAELLESTFSPVFDKLDLTSLGVGRACVSMLSGGKKLSPFSLETLFAAPPAGRVGPCVGVERGSPVEPPSVASGSEAPLAKADGVARNAAARARGTV